MAGSALCYRGCQVINHGCQIVNFHETFWDASSIEPAKPSRSDHCSLRIALRVCVVSAMLVRTRLDISPSCICSAIIATAGPMAAKAVAAVTETGMKRA